MSERLPKHLDDALYAAGLALQFLNARTLDQYLADDLLRSAVERQVEIVGEACRRALTDTPALRDRVPDAVAVKGNDGRLPSPVKSAASPSILLASAGPMGP